MVEIAELLGLSVIRVWQIEQAVLRKLRRNSVLQQLTEDLKEHG